MSRADEVEALRDELQSAVAPSRFRAMMSRDFKQHLEVLELLQTRMQSEFPTIITNLDTFFKWVVLRLYDDKVVSQSKAMELLFALCRQMLDRGYLVNDLEAACFLPGFVDKIGYNNDRMRQQAKQVVLLFV